MKKFAAFCVALVCILCFTSCESKEPEETSGLNSADLSFELNQDMLSEIGMTHEQLVSKNGKSRKNSNQSEKFENGCGCYYFDNTICNRIDLIDASEFFGNDITYMSAQDMTAICGLQYLRSYNDESDGGEAYFVYGDMLITVSLCKQNITRASFVHLDDLNYLRQQAGLSPDTLSSRYKFYGKAGIGFPEGATVEDFLNDPFVKSCSKKIVVKEKMEDPPIVTGKLTTDMIVGIDGYPLLLISL